MTVVEAVAKYGTWLYIPQHGTGILRACLPKPVWIRYQQVGLSDYSHHTLVVEHEHSSKFFPAFERWRLPRNLLEPSAKCGKILSRKKKKIQYLKPISRTLYVSVSVFSLKAKAVGRVGIYNCSLCHFRILYEGQRWSSPFSPFLLSFSARDVPVVGTDNNDNQYPRVKQFYMWAWEIGRS